MPGGDGEVWWLWNEPAEWVDAVVEYKRWLDERREAYQHRIESEGTERGEGNND
jgi:hypothetical protein